MTTEPIKLGRLWMWRVIAVAAAMLPFLLLPRERIGAGLLVLLGISFLFEFRRTVISRSKSGQRSNPWMVALGAAGGLGVMIGGCMMLLEN